MARSNLCFCLHDETKIETKRLLEIEKEIESWRNFEHKDQFERSYLTNKFNSSHQVLGAKAKLASSFDYKYSSPLLVFTDFTRQTHNTMQYSQTTSGYPQTSLKPSRPPPWGLHINSLGSKGAVEMMKKRLTLLEAYELEMMMFHAQDSKTRMNMTKQNDSNEGLKLTQRRTKALDTKNDGNYTKG
ncbi:hypothetical protein Fmac_005477 [Flemingia macrophylla]|uniref:Uncharacterized protein n=1 Tax=Flemingia macrophylla TaxID=520843 RepID=A0ABD1N8W8_9FABA